ncbi:hypothetical protein [Acinetobacter pragensis]|uniref:Lipoprotein n=2 Tax=Acinetobacter pragensis TaxID=1806892 RepID=A0A151XZR1_9GAMM|nr:hypothetical protein [Acinetobacter pragensis]KYQ71184.1 hypothetical protein AZH43_15920 [Acinetobacter pragensis]
MKKKTYIILFLSAFFIVACNARNPESTYISKIKVEPCGFDYDIDNYYCAIDKIKLYENKIGENVNYNKEYTVIKINDGKYIRLVVLNQKNKIVYPLNYQIDKNNSNVEHSASSNILCVTGNMYGYRNTYINSKICFKIVDGYFVKSSISENSELAGKIDLKKVKLPNSSEYFAQCLKKSTQKKCEKMGDLENHVYMIDKIIKESQDIEKKFKSENIENLNLSGVKILPDFGNRHYLIGEKYEDTEKGSYSDYYLIKIKPNVEVKYLGGFYSIDKQGNLTYRDHLGNNKNIKLN